MLLIYVTGDTHGDMQRFRAPALRRLKQGDALVVCGDFGFLWDGGAQEEKNLRKLGKLKYTVLFLDGTHENFDLLNAYPAEDWNGGKARHICGNLYQLMRGQVYELGGKTIFTFGGGESTEKQIRVEAHKWWPCEMPSLEEMRSGADHLEQHGWKVDYIFTHEPPPKTDFGPQGESAGRKNQLDAYLSQVMLKTKYEKWFFGSQHIDRKITYKNYAVFQEILPAEAIPQKRRLFGK